MGRISTYSQKIADAICELIADGKSIRQICSVDGMPSKSTVFKWLADNKGFADQYARAKEAQVEFYADELVEIADDISNDVQGELEMPNGVAVQRAKLRVDTRKWILSKLLAKKYGERTQMELSGDPEKPVAMKIEIVHVGRK